VKKAAPPLAGGAVAATQNQNGTDEPSRCPPHPQALDLAAVLGVWTGALWAFLELAGVGGGR
jgi:hypothetical protein